MMADCAGEQRDRGSLLLDRQQPTAESRDGAEHRERADAAEPGAGSISVTGPLTLESDGRATERGDEESKDRLSEVAWLQKISHIGECSLAQSLNAVPARNSWAVPRHAACSTTGASMRRRHREAHRTERIGWLRAAVLGANDGIVSTASLVVGVAAADIGQE